MTMRIVFALLLTVQLAGQVKFEATSQLVVLNVAARDKSGNGIEGLKASDFTVTEDGKTQQIKVFEFQRLEGETLPVPELKTRPAEAPAVKSPVNTPIAPSQPGDGS